MPDVQYVGTCKDIIEKKNDWYTIEILVPGKDWPIKADTKLEHLINEARAVRDAGTIATWTVSETESENINPRNNRPYTERRLEKVEVVAASSADAGPTAESAARYVRENRQAAGEPPPVDWDAKERRDFRSRAWAHTMSAFAHTIKPEESAEEVFARLQPLQRKIYEDICGLFAYPEDDSDVPF